MLSGTGSAYPIMPILTEVDLSSNSRQFQRGLGPLLVRLSTDVLYWNTPPRWPRV
jgi:hypothetical protein